VADLGDAGEVFRYLVGFWAFLVSPSYRRAALRRWREADWGQRSLLLLEGVIATAVGFGLPALLAWLAWTELRGA
jgi:hypothetical protein